VGDNLTGGKVWGGVEPGSAKNLERGETWERVKHGRR